MGAVAFFDLTALIRRYGLRYFIETGTGHGDSLAHAARVTAPGFEALRSCEIEPWLWHAMCERFSKEPRIRVFNQKSENFLTLACQMLPVDHPVLFWLDAHFPGADYGIHAYGDEPDPNVRLPLVRELDIIARERPAAKDVILVDDLRIWLDDDFEHGPLPPDVKPFCPAERSIDFVHDIFQATHNIRTFRNHEGYLMIVPRMQNHVYG
jgi:hypothetical protein